MGNIKKPKISIITTTYNRSAQLERAIKSVQDQTFQDYEHIIVDDASTDKTEELVRKYQKEDERIQYYKRDKNFGNHSQPKNDGIRLSKGEYIAYLDDDNAYLPTFLDNNLTEIEMSGVDVVYSDMRMFTEKDGKEEDLGKGIALNYDPQFLLNRNYIDTNMVLHKRDAVYRVGGWNEDIPRFADWNLFVRMAKAGLSFKRVPVYQTKYYLTDDNSAHKHPVHSWQDPETGMNMFDPTWFSPSGCYIQGPWLGEEDEREMFPRVAIFTITYDRLEYTQHMFQSMRDSTDYGFDWFVFDNGSKDGTQEWLKEIDWAPQQYEGAKTGLNMSITKEGGKGIGKVMLSDENKGLTYGSNACIDEILNDEEGYDIIIKVDNDCEFLTRGWLEDFIDLWKRNHLLYIGPYPEGLVDHPGGAPRVGHSTIGDSFVEVIKHLSGICAFVDANAYRNFRWRDEFYHGNQDAEASQAFINQGYMPLIVPKHRIRHMDTTVGQYKKYPEYFERRKKEKTTKVERSYEEIQEQESAYSEGTIWGKRVVESVKKFKDHIKGKRVVDIGCNDGLAMEEMERQGAELVAGVDIDQEKVNRAIKKGLHAIQGRAEELPYNDGHFDVVFCSHTFEHVDDGKKAAEEIMRVSKKAIIIVPVEEHTDNAAHFNNITSVDYLLSFFPGAEVTHQEEPNRIEKELIVILKFP